MKCIIYNQADGTAQVCLPGYNNSPHRSAMTEDETVAEVLAEELASGNIPPGADYAIVDDSERPKGRRRWGWVVQNGQIVVDMARARPDCMGEIRRMRNKDLKKLDVPYMRAFEVGDTGEQRRIAGLKQALRDLPVTFLPALRACTTAAELEAIWPDGLTRE